MCVRESGDDDDASSGLCVCARARVLLSADVANELLILIATDVIMTSCKVRATISKW